MKRASIIALFVTVLFLLPMLIHVGDPRIVESSGITPMRNTSTNAEGGMLYSGSGAARTATLKGLTTNETAGPLHIDSSSSDFGSVDLPAGWTGTNMRVDIPHSSMWVDRDPINNDLDDYHDERWVGMGSDSDIVQVPDEWTLIKNEISGTSHSDHPEHGVFEMNSDSNGVGGSRGWRFDAEYGATVTLASTDEIYFSQMIDIPRRALYSVHITFLYYVTAATDLQNQTYAFVRFGDHETKLYVHESGRTTNAWLVGEVVIPWSAYENITTPESLPFDIGIGTDLSGSQSSGYDSYTYIDEIYMNFEVSPFPEQVNLNANNTAIGGMTSGSVSPYVPDGANRDCTNDPSTGVDLDGVSNNGWLSIAVLGTGYDKWGSGFQFPLSIPQGAIITSAYIEVESAVTTSYVDMRLYASDEDTVTVFSSGTPHLEDRFDWVNTSVDWDVTEWNINSRYSSPDITRLVQKGISRSGWSTGNYICIMLEYMYSSTYNRVNYIKGTSHYDGADLARLFVNYMIPQDDTVFLSGSWSGSDTVTVEFTTNSSVDVMIEPSLYLNVTDTVDTLDNEQNTGTSFSVVNNSLAYWSANVLVSPPSGVTDVNLSLNMHDNWTFLNATDPDGDDRSSDVVVVDTVLSMSSTAIDIYGIWKFVFSGTNHVSDLQMGIGAGSYGDTVTFNVGDSAKFKGTAKVVGGSAMRLLLTDPSGQLFYASDDITQGAGGDFEWTGITVTSSWDAGIWYADVKFNDTAGVLPTEVGTYQRIFTVKHDTSLILQSPGDAVNDQLSVRVAGEMLYVEVQLMDDDNSQTVTGATVTMNWTVSGSPSDVTLEDYGTGDYGVALNTSDLEDAKRWRIEIDSYHQYYNNATIYFDLDLSHETSITYETPPSTPIGDDFTVKITVRDSFNGNPITGATITSNRTIVGSPIDHANGSYTVTLDGSGLGAGSYVYQINATPSETYLLESTVNIKFTLRNIFTAIYGVGGNSVSTPYEFDTSMTVTYNDTDHSFAGITGASNSVENPVGITASVTEISDGAYGVNIDVGTASPGTYLINVTLSKTNYHDATITIRLVISPHDTYIVVDFDSTIPWGVDSSFDVTWYDADAGGEVSASLQNVTVVSATKGTQGPFGSLTFILDVDGWTVGEYELNVSVYSSSANYGHAWTLVTLTVRAHHTTLTAVVDDATPWGSNTGVTVVFWDTDTDSQVPIANVTSITYNPTGYSSQGFLDYSPTLITSTWTVEVVSTGISVICIGSNQYYDSTSNTFDITIRAHHTTLTAVVGDATPWGSNTGVTVIFWDTDTNSQVPITNVTSITYNPTGYSSQGFLDYSPTLTTSTWTVEVVSTGISVICVDTNKYYDSVSNTFDITIRAHHTTLTAVVGTSTPWGSDTDVAVVFWDTDTDSQVPIANVTSITYNPTGYSSQGFLDYSPTLITSTWTVEVVSTGISVICVNTNKYYDSVSNSFDITIRAHQTTVTASADTSTPWGSDTGVTVVFWDTDTDSQVPITNVTSITYNPTGYSSQSPSGYSPTLTTGTWTVEVVSTGISVICVGTNQYYDSASNTFDITIRAHHTTLTAVVDEATPWGSDTGVTVVFWDTDTDSQVPITNVTSITYNPTGYSSQSPSGYSPTLTTGTWTVEVVSTGISVICVGTNQYYDSASNTFDITIRAHHTTLTAVVDEATPWGSDTGVTVVFWDTDTDSQVPIANVTSITYNPTGYSSQSPSGYSPTLTTGTWTVEVVSTGISVICVGTNQYYDSASNTFDITIRAHHTTLTAVVDEATPWGSDTGVTVVFWDTDTDSQVPIANVTSITYNPTGYSSQSPSGYSPTLTTGTWTVEVVSTGISVICVGTNQYYDSASNSFDITIRAHHTTLTAVVDEATPWGSDTGVTVVFWDTDTDSQVPIANVTSITYTPTGYSSQSPSGYSPTLTTGTWTVEVVSTGISVICVGTNQYYDSASNTFDITIRAHHTTVTASAATSTPWGSDTGVTVVFWDTDTDSQVPITNVTSITYNPIGYSSQNPSGYSPTLITGTWTVEVVSTGISVICVDTSKYYDSASNSFDLTIRVHYTSVTVASGPITPWGSNSPVTVVFWDLDTDSEVPIANVTTSGISFDAGVLGTQTFTSYTPTLGTSTWDVAVVNVDLTVTCVDTNKYYDSASNSFDLTIRVHYTSVTVASGPITPWGSNSPVAVVFWDLDTDSEVPIANVTTSGISFDAGVLGTQTFTSYTPTLATSTWDVAVVNVDLTVTCVDTNKYYDPASNTFDITVRAHHTTLAAVVDDATPWGSDTDITVVFWDTDTDSQVPLVNVTSITYNPTGYSSQGFLDYSPTLITGTWTVEIVSTGISVICVNTNKYYDQASNTFSITIRAHHTTVTASAGISTPWGSDTDVTVVFWDTDTDSQVPITNVTSITYNPTGYSSQGFLDYSPTLTTSTWTVEIVSTGISVICVDTNKYYDPASNSFDIIIREHFTSVTISANLLVPYGNDTPLIAIFWDLDTDSQVPIANVSNLAFTPFGHPVQNFGTYSLTLDTENWNVGTTSITLTATCVESNKYYELATHVFQVTTRSLWTNLYHEPTDLIFPNGDDFVIVLRVNVSESGNQYDGDPISALIQGEFKVENSTHEYTISIDVLGDGRYNLTIDASYFEQGDYTIFVTVDPTSDSHASAQLIISFRYRPARSFLSSPNYPQVITPYDTDVTIALNYTDIDRGLGITGATFTPEGITFYDQTYLGDGEYSITLDVSELAKGDHEFSLTASAGDYESKMLTFNLHIRIAYTYAIPTVGALDIPIGNDPVFYVEYWDTDHDLSISGATVQTTWIHTLIAIYEPVNERYRIEFTTEDTDSLQQNTVVTFNFSNGENYQFGIFNISVTLRTHNTDFRLVSAVEPTSYIGVINISVYYGDLDNPEGIKSHYAEFRVENATHDIAFIPYNDTALGSGFYILRISASQFPQGMQTFTVYVNWTGPVYTYQNRTLITTANIVGVESSLTLMIASEPTPYLGNMSYIFFYSDVTSGLGISNASYGGGNVHIYVSFQGESVDPSLVDIWEVNQVGQPGNYSIQFNTTIFGHTGLIYMNVYINWSRGAAPYYANRTDVISVRILARDTLVSIIPPTPTSYGENATFSFSFDDVTAGIIPIDDNPALSISLNLAEYALSYNSTTKLFTVSFDTSQFGAPLGQKPFTLDVEWAGAPFYANRTGRTITVTVITRLTVLDYQSPAPTPYMNNVTFLLNWTDVTTASITGVTGATVTLHDEGTPIPSMYYTWIWIQDGEYSVEFNTTYYAIPGTYDLEVRLTSLEFYISDRSATRSFNIMYRVTLLSFEPTDKQPYNSSLQFVLNFQDLLTLDAIGNGSSHVTLELLNASWFYSIEWKPEFQHYEFIVETYNHLELVINTEYTFWLRVSYASLSPFYGPDETYVTFELRERTSSLDLEEPPDATPYLDYAVFQVFYRDVSSSGGIVIGTGDFILQKGATVLVPGTNYSITDNGGGYYTISVNTTVLDGLGITEIDVFATWIGGSPYHEAADRTISIQVTKRETNVEITVPPLFTQYLDNVTFTFAYTDLLRGTAITSIAVSNIELWADGVLLSDTDFIMNQVGSAFFVSVNSTILSPNLVSNYNLTVKVDWNDVTPPFYFDDTTIVKVTTITRLIAYSIDIAQDAKLGDNITFSFTLSDADSGSLVVGALIGFDGQTVSLTRDVDFWVVEGIGSDLGRYTIYVDSLALFDIDRYRFDIDVSWNPSTQPFYANMSTIVLTASVREIETELILLEDQVSVLWTELANISVDYRNFFMGNLTPGATVTWDWPGVDQGSFTEVGSTGTYVASINTALDDIGTKILIIEAQKTRFETAIIYVTIIVRSLPSVMIGITPSAAVISLDRGAAVDLIMYLEDVVNSAPISNLFVTSEVWAELEGQFFYLSYNGTPGYYTTIIPAGNATLLEVGSYDVRLAAVLLNYEPAAHSFKIMLDQSRTQLLLAGDTTEDMSKAFTQVVEFRVNLVLPDIGNTLFYNGTVSWLISELGTNGNFTNMGNGTYFVVFNTTDIGFGIWPISFRARPWANASDYASSATQISLTITRIETTVEREASELDLVWGWSGNITFHFNGTFGLIHGANGDYGVGPYEGIATDLGNGTYLVPLDTRALNPGTSYLLSIIFTKENYQQGPSTVRINVLYIPTELILNISSIYEDPVITTQYVVPYGETLGIALLYNDTDSSEGYVGGLENANLTLNVISGPTIVIPKLFTIEELGGGHYRYLFDTTDISLLFPGSQPGPKEGHYTLTFRLALANRTTALWEIKITIIPLPTAIEIVSMDTSLEYGQTGQMVVKFIDVWRGHAEGTLITGANFTIDDSTVLELLEILDTYEDLARPGYYIIEYRAASILFGENIGASIVDITLSLPNVELGKLDTSLIVTVYPTETAKTLYAVFMFGTPSLFIIVLLAILYVKIWSVPKRLRQINSQVKSLSKGKIPKPIEEVKSRQEMIADLFNDTFQELELTRTAYQMPAESVEADIPEMGELLIQLSILTNLSPTELDEFKADISKMRMSEQAAFVKEVIHQESIRVARREDKTREEVVEEIAEEAKRRLAGDEAIEASGIDLDIALAGPMILAPEDEKTEDVITAITREAEDAFVKGAEGMTPSSDRLSDFEINELKKNLEQRGVPLHEIDTILEQARSLPRDLVEELVKSLESQEE